MLCDYADIRDRIAEPPRWWDERGVPRYCDFSPREAANIYADEAALAEVTCQSCGTPFRVAFSGDEMERAMARHRGREAPSIAERIRARELHYGDPPNSGCCAAGPTMNSEPRRVLEYWARWGRADGPASPEWSRDAALEIDITPDWVAGDAA